MKKIILITLMLLLVIPLAEAAMIEIHVAEILKAEMKIIKKSTEGIFGLSTELFNTGSIGFTSREREG
jgi:hypothetical protein